MTLRPVIVGTLALAMLAAGCTTASGTSTPPTVTGSPGQLLSAAVARTNAARTASVSLRVQQTGSGLPNGPINSVDTASGSVNFATKQSVLTFRGPGTTLGGSPIELVSTGGKAYVDAQAVGGTPGTFVEDTGQLPKPGSNGSLALNLDPSQLKGFAPSQLLSGLADLQDIKKGTTSTIGGIPVTEYASRFTSTAASPFGGLDATSSPGSPFPAPILDVWLDAQGRVVQVSSTLDLSSLISALVAGATSTTSPTRFAITVQENLSKFGVPIAIPDVTRGSAPNTSSPPTSTSTSTSTAVTDSCIVAPNNPRPTVGTQVSLHITGAPAGSAVRAMITRVNGAITTLTGQADTAGSAVLSFTVGQDRVGAPLPVEVTAGSSSCSRSESSIWPSPRGIWHPPATHLPAPSCATMPSGWRANCVASFPMSPRRSGC